MFKKFMCMAMVITMLSGFMVVSAENTNLLTNGGFESGISGWTLQDNSIVSVAEEAKFSGGYGLKSIVGSSTANSYKAAYQVVTGLIPGKSYSISFMMKVADPMVATVDHTLVTNAGLRMTFRANSIEGSPAISFYYHGNNSSWAKYKYAFAIPATGVDETTQYYLAFYQQFATGTVYIDDVVLEPNTNAFANGDFESVTATGFTSYAVSDGRGAWNTNYFVDSDIKYEGMYSLKVMSHDGTDPNYPVATGTDLRYANSSPLTAGKTYKLSFKVRANNTSVIAWVRNYMPGDFEWSGALPTANTWYERSYFFKATTATAGDGLHKIYFGISGKTPHGTVWYDDIRVTAVEDGSMIFGTPIVPITEATEMIKNLTMYPATSFTNGSTVGVLGAVKTGTTSGLMILACYDVSGGVRRLNSISTTSKIHALNGPSRMYTSLAIPASGNYEVEAFMWDSVSSLKSITKSVSLPSSN